MGLQAANQPKNLQTQTYYNRSVNAICQYRYDDFISEIKKAFENDDQMDIKLDKFVDRVAKRIEEALQSNEIINVFDSDFEKLGDDDGAGDSKNSAASKVARVFFDQTYCKNKSVTCIKFHPTMPHLAAVSLIEHLDFEDRAQVAGKSYDTHVLILNFSDSQVIFAQYALQTPVEISCLEFCPENPNVVIGGCINGQLIAWDVKSSEHKIHDGRKQEQASAQNGEEKEGGSQQAAKKMKEIVMSLIEKSHKSFVADIKFIPGSIRPDRKNPNEGKSFHFITCAEDGLFNIWDTRNIELSELKIMKEKGKPWVPIISITVFRQDGSGEMGFSRILFEPNQTTPTFWAASDEGELALIDWTIRPEKGEGNESKPAEYIQREYNTERNCRPCLALARSPFFPNLLMTVHDFHFAIWDTNLQDREEPIFRSANTFGSHNTCGDFSPTRPGVIFITKTNGIDIWDFYD